MSSSWFEQLEAQLEQQLEAFLGSHPEQQDLLEREELLERQRRLRRRRREIQRQAEQLRQSLLQLAAEITQWQQRVRRAQAAAADELARRADAHLSQLMGLGRDRWQALTELGAEFRKVDQELVELEASADQDGGARSGRPSPGSQAGSASGDTDSNELERAWAAFETRQDLEELRRKGHGPGA